MSAPLNPTMLAEHVSTQFDVVDDPSRACCLTLTSIATHAKTDRQEIFSLFFHGPADPFIPQGIHKLKHRSLGELELFLVPIGRDKDGFQYEAAFNNLIS